MFLGRPHPEAAITADARKYARYRTLTLLSGEKAKIVSIGRR